MDLKEAGSTPWRLPPLIRRSSMSERNGGGHKSTDGGGTWAAVNTGLGLTNRSVNALVIDPLNPQIVYAGTYYGGANSITFVSDFLGLVVEGPNSDCGASPPVDCTTLSAGFAAGATDGLDPQLGEVEQPPLPSAADILDARFIVPGIQGLLLDLRDPNATDPEWYIALQAGLGGYPLSLKWEPHLLPAGDWALRDTLDGGLGVDVDMTADSSLVITDPLITSLSITQGGPATVNVTYGPSWNMVSLPVTLAVSTFNVVFPDAVSAFAFNGGYQQVTELSPCQGYWLNLSTGGTYTLTGTAVGQCDKSLPVSWSMMGVPLSGTKVDDIVQNPVSDLTSVFGFTGSYVQKTGQDLLTEGQGFWFNLAGAGQVILNSGPAARPAALASAAYTGPVLWAQSGDQRQEIHLGVEVGQVTALPPLPPGDVLDTRVRVGGVESWQVPQTDKPTDYALRVQGADLRLGWDVPVAQSHQWELVVGDVSVPLTGDGAIDLGTHNGPVDLTVRVMTALPSAFALAQNYPNPFNPSTTFSYQLADDAEVVLSIWNLAGQLVRQLVHVRQPAGSHSTVWDGRNESGSLVANGVYLYEIQAGDFRSARKMVLIK
jgi:hypothetical protein